MILFKDRQEAGEKLVKKLKKYANRKDVLVFGIPRGGAAVGATLAKYLNLKFNLVIVRKLPIPQDPEMGFGAILSDGTILLNNDVIDSFDIQPEEIKKISQEVLKEIKRREKAYLIKNNFSKIKNKIIILVDDGLATGFTMLAAIKAIKKYQPKKIIVAVPVSPESSIEKIKPEVDEIICLYAQKGFGPFAVANFYKDFHDLSDEEVKKFLHERGD
ncbi:phosphoribosyltransferase [bacterium]|nr:phosphoribosyltransferase [bacterium]